MEYRQGLFIVFEQKDGVSAVDFNDAKLFTENDEARWYIQAREKQLFKESFEEDWDWLEEPIMRCFDLYNGKEIYFE